MTGVRARVDAATGTDARIESATAAGTTAAADSAAIATARTATAVGNPPGAAADGAAAATTTRRNTLIFCDVDETLITRKTPWDFLAFHLGERHGAAGVRWVERVRERVGGGMGREEANVAYFRCWAGEPVEDVRASGVRWYERAAGRAGFFHAGTRAELDAHRAAGATLVLVSGSCPAVLYPIAAAVGAAQVLCAQQAVRAGVFTGELLGGPMIGEGKREAVRAVLRAHPEVCARDCFGYGDHASDLPMLEEIGHPVVVGESHNAGGELARLLPGARVLTAWPRQGVT